MKFSTNSITTVLDPKTTKKKYPVARIIVLDDNINSFEHVAICLMKIIPEMRREDHGNLLSKLIGRVRPKYGEVPLSRQNFIMSKWSMKG